MPQRQKIRDSPIAEPPSSSDPLCGRDRHRHSGCCRMTSKTMNKAVIVAVVGVILMLVMLIAFIWNGYRKNPSQPVSTTRSPQQAVKGLLLGDHNGLYPSTGKDSLSSTSELIPTTQAPSRKQLSIGDTLSDNHRVEKVRPIKLPPPLEEEALDPQGEEPAPRLRHERHHHTSSHFRARTPGLWDPHPRYAFSAFGRRFRLDLNLGDPFLSPHLRVTTHQGHDNDEVIRESKPAAEEHERCFYTGTVYGDPSSSVAVNLCHGMTGHIRTADGSFFIEPMETWAPQSPTTLHAIYMVSRPKLPSPSTADRAPAEPPSSCGVDESMQKPKLIHKKLDPTDDLPDHALMSKEDDYEGEHIVDDDEDDEDDEDSGEEEQKGNEKEQKRKKGENSTVSRGMTLSRRKRSSMSKEYFVEVMVVADRKMMEYHKGELVNYVLTLMSIVSLIYKDASIGNPMTVTVVKFIQSNEDFISKKKDSHDGISAPEMLKTFCEWQHRMNDMDDSSPEHHDVALLLTRENICRNPSLNKCDTLGLAELGTMCDFLTSCAIVQDNGLSAAFTIAHELGHVLNMPHDDDIRCKQFLGGTRVNNVMSRMLDHNTHPWSWSNCSRHLMTEFLESHITGRRPCLLDPPPASATTSSRREEKLPGENFTEDRQCEFVFGPGSKICSYMPVCARLWCTTALGEEKEGCRTQHMPWADGTSCAPGMWCQKGECVPQNRSALQPIDGGWSMWQRWGPCSRSCGGGIKKSERACSSPPPSNGGKYCVGERVRFKSCRKNDCPGGSRDFREVQCSQFNNNNFSIPGLPPDVKWVPKYSGISPSDRCKLYCRVSHSNAYYRLGDKVKDGTTCGPDTYDVCINGKCHSADCSHTINPPRPLNVDICGKCGGDNSTCKLIGGEYNISSYGYRRVVLIPAGSSNIDIRQKGYRGTAKDDNYLALVNSDTGEYLLNGNYIVSMFRKLIIYGGTTIEYSGSDADTERINSSRPLSKDLILEVLSVGKLHPPNVYYQYTVLHDKPVYRWEMPPEWTRCTSVCQGEQLKKPICIKETARAGNIVRDDFCSHLSRPRHQVQLCNTHCTLRWKISHESPCSVHTCYKTRTIQCVREVHSRGGSPQVHVVEPGVCKDVAGKPNEHIQCQMSCSAEWKPTEWSPCSATCGEGVQRRKFVCVDSNGKETVPKYCKGSKHHMPEEQKCKIQECPRWATGEWTPCSVTCGIGEQQRPYWCELEGKPVAEGYCRSHGGDHDRIPVHIQHCKALPCPYLSDRENWIQEEAPLPTAHPSSSSSPLVSPTTALALPRTPPPPSSRWSHSPDNRDGYLSPHTIPRHGPSFRWRAGLWGPCSQTCREEGSKSSGYLRRLVACQDGNGRDADDSLCPLAEKPLDVTPCQLPICPKWIHGEWGPCNVSCGEGRQLREVGCRGSEGQALAETKCSVFKKPPTSRVCAAVSCPTWQPTKGRQREVKFVWRPMHWEKCSTTCGPGFQRRKIVCARVNRSGSGEPEPLEPLPAGPGPPELYCQANLKPAEHQRCQIAECSPLYKWKTGRWKPCSEPCGKKGKQRRMVSCIKTKPDGQTKRVPKHFCSQELKPHTRQKCNRHSCDYSSCTTIRDSKWRLHGRAINLRDGEYHLLIGGVSMPIYCHGMGTRTNSPKEYLTLPAGERENYSEFYDRRLLNPNTCPDGGLRRDDCDCTIDSNGKGGLTVFSRVRINVTSLKIDSSDMTFARQLQGSKVAFGRGGDCYSALDCPQGRFSINLIGTRLRVHEDVKWEGSGPGASVHIDRRENGQSIIGRCGGYCGACQPAGAPWIALEILPTRNEGSLR